VDVRYYSIIYEAIDDIKAVLTACWPRRSRSKIVGLAAVRSVFRSSKFGTVAGCMVIDGYVAPELSDSRTAQQRRHLRGRVGILEALQDDVNEVRAEPSAASA